MDTEPTSPVRGVRYRQLAADLAREIQAGRHLAGERLPSVRGLARLHQVSINTAVAVLRQLEQQGLIEARAKTGYFVRRVVPVPALVQPKAPRTARDVAVNDLVTMLGTVRDVPDLVPLGAAVPEPDWFPAKALARLASRRLRQHPGVIAAYGPVLGEPGLREAVARRYRQLGVPMDGDELMITNRCSEALHLALRSVGQPGAVVAVESPTYFGFLQIIQSLGMKALELPTDPRDGLRPDALEKALSQPAGRDIRCLLLVGSFNNPLGSCIPQSRRQALVQLCADHDIPLIEDDIYGDLHHAGGRPLPFRAHDRTGQVILCSSFSKTLAPGAGIGWIAGGRWRDAIHLAKRVLSQASPTLMQLAIADYMQAHAFDRHLARLRALCATQVGRFATAIARHFPEGTAISQPAGGFVLWVQMPREIDSDVLFRRALEDGISILPGRAFSTGTHFSHCIRVNCGRTWSGEVEDAIVRLGRHARSLQDEGPGASPTRTR